jgi:hypothetical protein
VIYDDLAVIVLNESRECHSERSEESLALPAMWLVVVEIPHSVRNDTPVTHA